MSRTEIEGAILGDIRPRQRAPAEVVGNDEEIYQGHGGNARGRNITLLGWRNRFDHDGCGDLARCHKCSSAY